MAWRTDLDGDGDESEVQMRSSEVAELLTGMLPSRSRELRHRYAWRDIASPASHCSTGSIASACSRSRSNEAVTTLLKGEVWRADVAVEQLWEGSPPSASVSLESFLLDIAEDDQARGSPSLADVADPVLPSASWASEVASAVCQDVEDGVACGEVEEELGEEVLVEEENVSAVPKSDVALTNVVAMLPAWVEEELGEEVLVEEENVSAVPKYDVALTNIVAMLPAWAEEEVLLVEEEANSASKSDAAVTDFIAMGMQLSQQEQQPPLYTSFGSWISEEEPGAESASTTGDDGNSAITGVSQLLDCSCEALAANISTATGTEDVHEDDQASEAQFSDVIDIDVSGWPPVLQYSSLTPPPEKKQLRPEAVAEAEALAQRLRVQLEAAVANRTRRISALCAQIDQLETTILWRDACCRRLESEIANAQGAAREAEEAMQRCQAAMSDAEQRGADLQNEQTKILRGLRQGGLQYARKAVLSGAPGLASAPRAPKWQRPSSRNWPPCREPPLAMVVG